MRKGLHKILVTGGAGFIGSAFVRLLLRDSPREDRDCPRQSNEKVSLRGLSLKNKKGLSPQTKGLSPKGTDPEVNARGTA